MNFHYGNEGFIPLNWTKLNLKNSIAYAKILDFGTFIIWKSE